MIVLLFVLVAVVLGSLLGFSGTLAISSLLDKRQVAAKKIISVSSTADTIKQLEMSDECKPSKWDQAVKDAELKGQLEYHENHRHLDICGCQLPYCSTDRTYEELYQYKQKMCHHRYYTSNGYCKDCSHYDSTKVTSRKATAKKKYYCHTCERSDQHLFIVRDYFTTCRVCGDYADEDVPSTTLVKCYDSNYEFYPINDPINDYKYF